MDEHLRAIDIDRSLPLGPGVCMSCLSRLDSAMSFRVFPVADTPPDRRRGTCRMRSTALDEGFMTS
ncbi:hypothetical protein WM40_00100 [Robbsia andropogonis]|uniref:Uncharacterized protein n=1 Tax=Robbsia andropogonis TaxID=28092 RepID=A0A0F5K4W8_9BURK|nr:hypothetical protein WM40_00100 [Robbsia andropogonis]